MMKYTSNTWHALKVVFANEIGNVCKKLNVDSHEVMDIFCRDEKLNLSSYYLKPGFAFGGSCLPKDVRALQYRAKEMDVELPLISQILPSNRQQIQNALEQVLETGRKKVGLLGFSFKAGTDDLRESPMVILAEALLGKGVSLTIYDNNVSLAKLMGANKEYIEKQIPHLSSLLCTTIDEVLDRSEVIVVGNQAVPRRSDHHRPRPAAALWPGDRGRLPRHLLVARRAGRDHQRDRPGSDPERRVGRGDV
jgi:GDP-mannose 6-dehydrogenase